MNERATLSEWVGRSLWVILLSTGVAVALAATVAAHSGPTDSNRCHFSEGEGYHCH